MQGLLSDKKFLKRMLSIALPVMIQNFISSFLNMIDTVMVGKMGETEIAAVGIANQYFFFFHMFLIGIAFGCAIFVAQFWGKKDIANIRRILGIGLVSSLIVSLIFMLVGFAGPARIIGLFNREPAVLQAGAVYLRIVLIAYIFTGVTFTYNAALRAVGNAFLPMMISGVALFVNAFFNYVLIFGKLGFPELGVAGAAMATVIARVLETVILVASVYLSNGVLAAKFKELTSFTLQYAKDTYRIVLPTLFNDINFGLANLIYQAVYGWMGSQAVAAVQICNTINNMFMIVVFGLGNAATVMIGNSIGAGREEEAKIYAGRFLLLSLLTGIILGVFLALAAQPLLSFFNVSETVSHASRIILYTMAAVFVVRILGFMYIVGVLRGGGDVKQAFYIEAVTMWLIGVPLTILGAMVFRFPVYVVYALAVAEEVTKCFIAAARVKSGKWIKNVTRDLVME
ncbi:MAG TPA: MATE family efflux transporter [Firmicutes bacterium]|nr:MATE family efflux transporter [Bacillota bacterium]